MDKINKQQLCKAGVKQTININLKYNKVALINNSKVFYDKKKRKITYIKKCHKQSFKNII